MPNNYAVYYIKNKCQSSADDHSNISDEEMKSSSASQINSAATAERHDISDEEMKSSSASQINSAATAERHDLKTDYEIIASQDNFGLTFMNLKQAASHQDKIPFGLKEFFQKVSKTKIYHKLFQSAKKQLNFLSRSINGRKSANEKWKHIPVEKETLEEFLESITVKNSLSTVDPKICDPLVIKASAILNLLENISSIYVHPNIKTIASRFLYFQPRLQEVVLNEAILARCEHVEASLKQLSSIFTKIQRLNKVVNCSMLSHYLNYLKSQEKTLTQRVNNSLLIGDSQLVFVQILNDTLEELITFMPYATNLLEKVVELSALNLSHSGNSLAYKEKCELFYKITCISPDIEVNLEDKTVSLSLEDTVSPNKEASTTQAVKMASNSYAENQCIRNLNKLQYSNQIVTSSAQNLECNPSGKVELCRVSRYGPHPGLAPDHCKIKNDDYKKQSYDRNREMKENIESGKTNSSVSDIGEFATVPGYNLPATITSVPLLPCLTKSHTLTISEKLHSSERGYRGNEEKLDKVVIDAYNYCSEEKDMRRHETVEMEIDSDDNKNPSEVLETDRIVMVLPFLPEIMNQNPVLYYRNLSGDSLESSSNKIILKPSLEVIDHACNQNHEETSLEEYLTAVRELITLYEKMKLYQKKNVCQFFSLVAPLIPIKSSE